MASYPSNAAIKPIAVRPKYASIIPTLLFARYTIRITIYLYIWTILNIKSRLFAGHFTTMLFTLTFITCKIFFFNAIFCKICFFNAFIINQNAFIINQKRNQNHN